MAQEDDGYVVDFPTLWVVPSWIEAHCIVPDGFRKGEPFVMSDWQLWCTVNHYRVKADAVWVPERPVLGPAFECFRSLIVGPQKSGKGPWSAAVTAGEGVGPALFAGWAGVDEGYACSDHHCGCGWEYAYDPGEPMGMPWPTPLIQLTATSEDQVANVYNPLKAMIKGGPLGDLMRVTEGFIALPGGGEIAPVTSSALSRLGNPVTFVLNDESGLYTKTNKLHGMADTQMRGAAGMGGRTMQTTNCWDPSEQSTAQETFQDQTPGTFIHYRKPPANLSYRNKEERRKIHAFNYDGSWWVNLDSIESVAAALVARDPGQAERFFGNRIVPGSGTWLADGLWDRQKRMPDAAAA